MVHTVHADITAPQSSSASNGVSGHAAPRLRTDHLSVHFEDRSALEDVSVNFFPAQTTSLVGPNGAGKSTLLRCLDGLLAPTHGAVYLAGEPVRRPSARIAYVPQRSEVDWTFPISVLDVVLMGRSLRQSRLLPLPRGDREAAMTALETVAMQRFTQVQIGALSGGQQQRVFLARALVQDADVYLLDEPFTGVDVPSQTLILEVLYQLCLGGKTVIFATHDLAMAAESADNCLLLNRRVVASGPPRDVLTAENLQATFGGAALVPLAGAARP
ncbi:MAG: metal ABC transporter ATP-binding protein [Thermomicrobiales bacterium]|nr:metal ABC transporter ATP-binding protein [Thermomicrobiales bacterium]